MLTIYRCGAKGIAGICRSSFNVMQVANLTGRTTRGEPLKLKKPFPYKKRYLSEIEALMDITVKRVEEENAKLIVVDGPIASGKSAFMKPLAEEFDLFYMDQPTMDEVYLTTSGFDLRVFDEQLPETVRTYDHRNFCMCPTHPHAGPFQLSMLILRFSHHVDAITHILNTGQGVIMERSPLSDFAFIEAMLSEGYIIKRVKDYYMQVREVAKPLLLRPHVVIYLDVPVAKVQERIKKRNLSFEVNSPALTTSFLQKMEDTWKKIYLNEARKHSEVLVYDWSEGGDIDVVIEDLEKLELDPFVASEYGLLTDWKTWRRNWRQMRKRYTNDKTTLMNYLKVPNLYVPEVMVPSDDSALRTKLYRTAPGYEYEIGFNPKQGDSLFKIFLGIPSSVNRVPGNFAGM